MSDLSWLIVANEVWGLQQHWLPTRGFEPEHQHAICSNYKVSSDSNQSNVKLHLNFLYTHKCTSEQWILFLSNFTFEIISDGDSVCKDKSDKSYCQQQVITPHPQNTDDGNIHPLLRSSLAASPTPAWVWRLWTAPPASVRWAGHTPCYICPRNNSAMKM